VEPAEDRGHLPDRDDGISAAEVHPAVDPDRPSVIGRADLDENAAVAGDDRARHRNAGRERGHLEGSVGAGEIRGVGHRPEHLLERPGTARRLEPPDPAHLATGRDRGLAEDPAETERVGRLAGVGRPRADDRRGHPGQGSRRSRAADDGIPTVNPETGSGPRIPRLLHLRGERPVRSSYWQEL
jgi:hypothetical protein